MITNKPLFGLLQIYNQPLIHDNPVHWHIIFNGATDWLAAVLPTNQKPGLKIPFNSLVKHENLFMIQGPISI